MQLSPGDQIMTTRRAADNTKTLDAFIATKLTDTRTMILSAGVSRSGAKQVMGMGPRWWSPRRGCWPSGSSRWW